MWKVVKLDHSWIRFYLLKSFVIIVQIFNFYIIIIIIVSYLYYFTMEKLFLSKVK